MLIKISALPNRGKSLLAILILKLVQEHGGLVVWGDDIPPVDLKEGYKKNFLKNEIVTIITERLKKEED